MNFKTMIRRALSVALLFLFSSFGAAEGTDWTINTSGKTLIKRVSITRGYGTTFLILSKNGTAILLDPFSIPKDLDPAQLDAVTVTHSHFDHNDAYFIRRVQKSKSTRLSLYQAESFQVKDAKITGILSSHDSVSINPEEPSNVLYLIEIDGLRIVHMGDIGQEALSDEQLKALGRIDIAFTQLVNGYSGMSLNNEKGFKIIRQLHPQIVIPTHTTDEATKRLGSELGELKEIQDSWAVSTDDLKSGKKQVIALK